ncbi:LOW QUALITY PROTEIN: AF4/FMR2 family member 3 [Melanotaenia boesemani]|uniref:LOW QUALITY PROTEIN: AF4/FMR2 family member 3 n=1 Tax=Melanotaenia boesemani TaxID=1250792 RepID=UPI001C045956|nr:LOW QUALITY PROTEIN: AF4/FMR2 family member 3 [Melanotaenia boesemani]
MKSSGVRTQCPEEERVGEEEQEVQQDEDLFSTGFNLFGEPYKTNKGDALASRVQNTLGSYEEMKDLLTSHSNQSHLVGIPKSNTANNNLPQTPSSAATDRVAMESQLFSEALLGGLGGGGGEGSGEKRMGGASSSSSASMQPPTGTTSTSSAATIPHQNSKKSRSSMDWSRGGHGQSSQATGLVLGLGQNGQGQVTAGAPGSRGKMSLLDEQQMQRHEELFSSFKDELDLKEYSSPSSSSSSSTSSSSSRRHLSHSSKTHPLPDGGSFRSSAMDGCHFKSSSNTENGVFKSSPFENEIGSHLSTSSSPLASTSVLATPTPGLTTPTSGLTTPTFPPGSLSGKPIAVQQKPTAYVRPMDGQDQAPSDSPQLKPPLVAAEGFNNSQPFGGTSGNVKNKLPKLSLTHTSEVSLPNDSSCVEEILREMTHSWPPPLTAIHTPGKADQTKFPIPNKEPQHVTSGYNTQKRCTVSANKPAAKPPTAPQKSMLEDDLKISSDEEEAEQQVSDKSKARATALSGASGSSSESESSSESDTDESESSSSDSEYNQASRTHTPEPEPPSSNKWQLDSWLNKVQAQTKPLVPPQQEDHGAGSISQDPQTFSPGSEAPGVGTVAKTKPCGSNNTAVPAAPAVEHKDTRTTFCTGRERAKAKLNQKASGEGQRSKMRLSPGLLSGQEVTTPRRNTTGKKQPRRTERSNSVEDNPSQTWSRANQQSPAAREKDLLPPPSLEHQNPPRPRSKPPSGKTAPRKEPRSAANSNSNAATPPAALQQAPVPVPAVTLNQDKRKHRGPSTRITPKSREFIETDSSSSSSDCQSDTEEAVKIPALPPQSTRSVINTQTLSNTHIHAPLLPSLGSAGAAGSLATFGATGLRVKDSSSVAATGSSSSNSSSSGICNSLSISNISGPFGTSVPDPGGLGGQSKDLESMSPPSNVGHEVPLSPLREYHEIQSLWVKIDLSLLTRVPGQGVGDKSRVANAERDGSEGRDRGVAERERQKLVKGEKQEEENERLVQDRERQGDRDRLADRDRQMDREDRERFGFVERERTVARDREKLCQGLGVLDTPPVQEQSNPRLAGRTERGESGGKHRRLTAANMVVPTEKHTSKSKRKHKAEHGESSVKCNKKLRLDKDCLLLPPCISPIHNHKNSSSDSSLNRKQSRRRDDKLLPPLLSPLSDEPPQKRTCDGVSSLNQEGGASGLLPSSTSSTSTSSSSHRHRRGEGKVSSHVRNGSEMDSLGDKLCGDSYHANGHSDSEAWSEPLMDPAEPRRPRLSFTDMVHSADYYMQEAKRLKHKADALMDKFGKAVNYADGALSFIECGNAMERDPLEAKSPYTMYSETVELIRYAMRLKNFTSHSATVFEKRLAVLCNRCLSLLYLRMFHLKKDHAVKYSRSLMDYFKNSAKTSQQAPSPWRTNGKVNGTPSPLSLSPSPASSGGAGGGAAGSSGSVAIPQRIHHMAASHVNITNNILRSYEHWETADRLATDSQDFFQELDSVMEPLSQQSSMTELVRYIRQGLHWLRIEAHLS